MPFEIQADFNAADATLRDAVNKIEKPAPLMRAISAELASVTAFNFLNQGRPAWLPLKNPSPRRQGGQILQDSGRLRDSITPFSTDDTAGVGTNVVYAAIQHLGGKTRPHVIEPKNKKALAFGGRVVKKVNHPGSTIPARNFMPISGDGVLQPEAGSAIESITQDYLRSILA